MARLHRTRLFGWVAVACVSMLVLGIAGCSDDDTGLVVNYVSVTPALLEEGQVAIVEVLVTNKSGSPSEDKTVYLEATPGTAGEFSAEAVQTNALGVATTTFTAQQAGSVLISARAETNPSKEYTSVTIEEADGGGSGGGGGIEIEVSPARLPADGQSTATVKATITDVTGAPIPDETVVKFTAGEKFTDVNGDGIWSDNVDELDYDYDGDGEWDAIGIIESTVLAEAGVAIATFTAGSNPGLVHIKVTSGDAERHASGEITVSLFSSDSIDAIVLTPEWQQIQVTGTAGVEWARIVAETFDVHGNPGIEGQPVDFTITGGPGGGESINGDGVGPVTVLTDALGRAVATLNAGMLPGTVRVRARAGSVVSSATQVTIRSGPPADISLGVEDPNVPCWELIGCINKVTAVVVDQWGNEVPDSTSVYFGTEQGLIEGAAETQIVPTVRGKAVTYWNSAEPKNDGYVCIWCETSGGTVADSLCFIESGPPASGTFTIEPDAIPADGVSTASVVIEVLDINGVFVDTDTPILVRTNLGTLTGFGTIGDGVHYSISVGEFTSPVLTQDYSYTIPDDGVGATATITARSGGFVGTGTVTLLTGDADPDRSLLMVPDAMGHGATEAVRVKIFDHYGNPLGGHRITLTAQFGGTVSGPVQITNEFGVAAGFTFTTTSDLAAEVAYITAADSDPGYGGGLILTQGISIRDSL